MEELEKRVRRARRRLGIQRFVGVLGWCWFATGLAAAVLILVDKLRPLGVDAWIWGAGAVGLGLAAAALWAFVSGRGRLDAAMEIDCRWGLKERVSSTMALSPDERRTDAGHALIQDATGRLRRIEVSERFGISPGRQLLLPVVPAVAAILVALLVSPAVVDNPVAANTAAAVKKQVKKSSDALRRKLAKRREQAREAGLKDAAELFDKLERGTKDLGERNRGDRKKALLELNDLAKQLQKRRQELGGVEKVRQQLNQMKNIDRGPADKFAQAIGRGDFKKAIGELEKLKKELAGGKLTDQQKKELADQLDAMKEKLQKLGDAHKAMQKDLQDRVDQARRSGKNDEADKLQQQLDQLRQQCPQMQQLADLADQLGQCSKAMKDGQLADAAEMLDQIQAGVGDLKEQLEEMEMLQDAMDQLAQARDQMNCPHCEGGG